MLRVASAADKQLRVSCAMRYGLAGKAWKEWKNEKPRRKRGGTGDQVRLKI
jgi:hypothetical protein